MTEISDEVVLNVRAYIKGDAFDASYIDQFLSQAEPVWERWMVTEQEVEDAEESA